MNREWDAVFYDGEWAPALVRCLTANRTVMLLDPASKRHVGWALRTVGVLYPVTALEALNEAWEQRRSSR